MAFIYTRSDLKTRMNSGIHGRIGVLISSENTMNTAVRRVIGDVDLRSARRKATLSPNLFSDIFDYAAPSDLKAGSIIDIPPQAKRNNDEFFLIPTEEFDRKKSGLNGFIALDDFNGTRVLKIALDVDDKSMVISTLDTLTAGGGTWVLFGDGENLRRDFDNFIKESGSIRWDISAAGGTTAGIQNTGLNSFDLDDDYLGGNGAAFVWAYLTSATDVTNFILRLGSSSSVYHSKTITTQHDGTAFVNGWNLLRFDLTSLTDTGTPDDDVIDFVAIFMTKATGKVSETDYRFDSLVLKKGEIHEIRYYSKFGWQSSAGAYKENSTIDSDLLVADTDEFELYVEKAIEIAAKEAKDYETAAVAAATYKEILKEYKLRNFSESKVMTNQYYAY